MTLRAGREFLAIPGPTTVPDEVLRAMHRPPLDIYSDEMVGLTDGLLRDLGKLFATAGRNTRSMRVRVMLRRSDFSHARSSPACADE